MPIVQLRCAKDKTDLILGTKPSNVEPTRIIMTAYCPACKSHDPKILAADVVALLMRLK